ncbi:ATP synthase F1 subcomplex delta subunit [Desulfonauticus submarinus]|uniref:ATP synthase subunit delta n=1 Tax=Desulfonauticus submarinus TaxID=206665 RepID=A0A1H0BAI6_9BACT|nr:ATP synthase F1 subunit delta [Desulfonauticus submarinus]SDN42617.1 ATP synthase F1 subcomplex delta subunit [Desulfonauticus submarinus]
MRGNIVARRYARALFALGQKEGQDVLLKYGESLEAVCAVLEVAPELLRIFSNPIFTVEEKKAILAKVLEKVDPEPMVRNFCFLLADKNRLAFLPEIKAYYGHLLDLAQGIVRGELFTAIELEEELKTEIAKKLEEQSKSKVVLDYKVDPNILGGLVLKVGDKVLDASIKAQLQILKENIKRGE